MRPELELPTDGPLTDAQRAAARDAVKAHLRRHKMPQGEVARAINYSDTTVSMVLAGKYDLGDEDRVLRPMLQFVQQDAQRRSGARPIGFYDTNVFLAIRALASYAKSNALSAGDLDGAGRTVNLPRIVVGFGPAGCGKSCGALAYCQEDPRAILVTVGEDISRVAHFARAVWDAMSPRSSRPPKNAVQQVMRLLRGTQRLLIVDEGHRLNFRQCEYLRDLADRAGIPIMILATQEFYDRVTQVRRRAGKYQYDQFTSRIGFYVDLTRGTDGRGGTRRPIYSIEDIRAIMRRDKLRLTTDAIEFLQAIACAVGIGMMRCAMAVFDKAARSAARKDGLIDYDLLVASLDRSCLPAGLTESELREQIGDTLKQNRAWNSESPRRAAAAG